MQVSVLETHAFTPERPCVYVRLRVREREAGVTETVIFCDSLAHQEATMESRPQKIALEC